MALASDCLSRPSVRYITTQNNTDKYSQYRVSSSTTDGSITIECSTWEKILRANGHALHKDRRIGQYERPAARSTTVWYSNCYHALHSFIESMCTLWPSALLVALLVHPLQTPAAENDAWNIPAWVAKNHQSYTAYTSAGTKGCVRDNLARTHSTRFRA